jgi:hypothetical protein
MTSQSVKEATMNKGLFSSPEAIFGKFKIKRGVLFGFLIVMALLSFEMFNYCTTEYSLADLLGDLQFLGIKWATILAIAFCGIDFAGLARMFTPEQGADEPAEVWYLFGAWLLAATMNAFLTWWGVSVAVLSHEPSGNSILGQETVLKIVPVFVAIMVWLIRVLIIGTFSLAGDRLFSQSSRRERSGIMRSSPVSPRFVTASRSMPAPLVGQATFRSIPKPAPSSTNFQRPEPSYHPISVSSGYSREDPTDPL